MVRADLLMLLAATLAPGCVFDRSGIASLPNDGPPTDRGVGEPVDHGGSHDRQTIVSDLDGPGAQRRLLRLTFKNKARSEALSGFVVLVTLTPSRFDYPAAAAGGADLRFVDADGKTTLPHEIERWAAGGTSFVWVRVPRIDAASNQDFITLSYGDPRAGQAQDPGGVWAGFAAVYHLGDDPGLPPPQIRDSTTSAFHGTAKGAMTPKSRIDGQIGRALAFAASQKDRIEIGDRELLNVDPGEARTVEAWFKTSTDSRSLMEKESFCQGWALKIYEKGQVLARLATGTGCPNVYKSFNLGSWGKDCSDSKWHHAAFVIDRKQGTAELYVDGKLEDTNTVDITLSAANGVAKIGSNYNDSNTFNGAIDEVRVSRGARSAQWIDAQHASMTDRLLVYSPVP